MAAMDVSQLRSLSTMQSLNEERKNPKLCDVIINVSNHHIHAHRCILAVNSPYFRAMFTGDLAESRQKEVLLKETDVGAVESLIDFIYTGKLLVDPENVEALLMVASLLQLEDVMKACSEFMAASLDPANCIGVRRFADAHSFLDLVKTADKYIHQHFEDLLAEEEFMELGFDYLMELLSSDDLGVDSEETAAVAWLSCKKQGRRKHTSAVMEKVRFCVLNSEFLVDVVNKEAIILGNKQCRRLLDDAKNYYLLSVNRRSTEDPQARPRQGQEGLAVVLAVGGMNESCSTFSRVVERYDVRKNEWSLMTPMAEAKSRSGAVVIGNALYVIGGYSGLHCTAAGFEEYNLLSDERTSRIFPSAARRSWPGAIFLRGFLYVLGGHDGDNAAVNTLQRYSLSTCQVEHLASMTIEKRSMGVGVLDGQIFSCGGVTGGNILNIVECYDPKSGLWKTVAPMDETRFGCTCITLKNRLYVIGGIGGQNRATLASCECYDLRTGSWSRIASMNQSRHWAGLTTWRGCIYAVGGNENGRMLRSAEMYNPELNIWSTCAPAKDHPAAVGRSWVSFSSTL